MREKDIEQYFNRRVRGNDFISYKLTSPNNAGVPDRVLIAPKRTIVFIEFKNDKGRLSHRQEVQIDKLKSLGHKVQVINSKEGVDEFIKNLKTLIGEEE